jgi:hypothetical protein
MSEVTRYPLSWPAARARTRYPQRSKFKVQSFTRVRDELLNELKLLGATNVVLSTNLRLRQDGLPLAGQAQPSDAGVAVYFKYRAPGGGDRDVCFACDRWTKIEDNLQAVRHTIEALRGIARWGTGDMVAAAFQGFAQLPAARIALRPWWDVIGVANQTPTVAVHTAYLEKAKKLHPDRGGSHDAMVELNDAFERFKKERGL